MKAVNKQLIGLYWEIGKSIVEKQEKYGWGKSIRNMLCKDMAKPMGVAEYQITETLPEKLKKYLPSPEKLEASLANN